MKQKIYTMFFILFLCSSFVCARIEIGDEINIKSVSWDNLDDPTDAFHDKRSYVIQRTRLYVEGEIQKNVIGRLQLQSLGMWGTESSTATIVYQDYTYPNFTPFVEHAYLSFEDVLKDSQKWYFPFDIRIGKQPISYGDGFIVDDNDRGLFAWKFKTKLPFRFGLDAFQAQVHDGDYTSQYNTDCTVKGTVLSYSRWEPGFLPSFSYIIEDDKSRMRMTDGDSKKVFYGARVEGKTEEKLFYRIETMYQGGKATKDNPNNSFEYDAFAFVLGAWARSKAPTFGDTMIRLEYAYGTGDRSGNYATQHLTRRGFSPLLATRNHEKGDTYYGEIFSELRPGLTDKRLLILGLDSNPYKTLHVAFNYLFYAKQNSKNSNNWYGEEVDTILSVTHAKTVDIRFVYAFFFPGEAITTVGKKASDIIHTKLEISYAF